MHRTLLVLLLLTTFACATVPAPVPAQTDAVTVPSSADCNPGLSLVNATLWIDSAAEYDAVTLGTYAAARRALDSALADPSWIGALEETSDGPMQPPAVIVDADETIWANTPLEKRFIDAGKTYDTAIHRQWMSEGTAPAVPGAVEFLNYARSRGVTVFYVTNRDADLEPPTRRNLESLGFPLEAGLDTVLQRGENGWDSDKGPRRAHVAKSYRLVILVGDDLNDFADAREAPHADREAIVQRAKEWWGTRWFMIPNAMYGSWERAAIGRGGSPCEQLQKKIDVMRD